MQSNRSWRAADRYLKAQLIELSHASRSPAGSSPSPFITLSRQAGAGGLNLAARIAGLLNEGEEDKSPCPWTVFDRDLVRQVLDAHPFPEDVVHAIEEERAPEIAQSMLEFFGLKRSSHGLVAKTSRAMLQLASLGHAIFVGHAGSIVTRRLAGGFHVRLIASSEKRVAHIMAYDRLTADEALAKMKKEDGTRRAYAKKYFEHDIADPLLYTITVKVDRLDPAETARLIVESLRCWQRSVVKTRP